MEGDALLALMRLTRHDNKIVADLAGMALKLARDIRDAEARADQAEAALHAEQAARANLEAAIRRSPPTVIQSEPDGARRSVKITRQTSVVFEFH